MEAEPDIPMTTVGPLYGYLVSTSFLESSLATGEATETEARRAPARAGRARTTIVIGA